MRLALVVAVLAALAVLAAAAPARSKRVVVLHRGSNYEPPGPHDRVLRRGRHASLVEKDAVTDPANEEEDRQIFLFGRAAAPTTLLEAVQGAVGAPAPDYDGAGVALYVLDSGCDASHPAFAGLRAAGRFAAGPSFVDGEPGSGTDARGHGTAVAEIAAVQLAPGVNLTCVRVFGAAGSGTSSGLALALDWVAEQCRPPRAGGHQRPRCVVNLSGGGAGSALLDRMADEAAALDDLAFVAAAGNEVPACAYSPGRAANAVGVGATTVAIPPAVAGFSALGSCLDVFAPGSDVQAAGAPQSGTSFAAPVVAAAVAMVRQAHPTFTALEARSYFLDHVAVRGVVVRVPPGDGTPDSFVAFPRRGAATLASVDAGPFFAQWRAEWVVPDGAAACVSAASGSGVWQLALAPVSAVALAPGRKFRPRAAPPSVVVVSADGRGRFVSVSAGGRYVRAADDPSIRARRVVWDGAAVAVQAWFEGAWVTQIVAAVPAGGGATMVAFANARYADVDVVVEGGCGAGDPAALVPTPILPPCEARARPRVCAAATSASAARRCVWRGAHYKCRPRAWCGFADRNACAAARCAWRAGAGCGPF